MDVLENGNYEGKKRVGKLKSLEKSKLGLNRLATKTGYWGQPFGVLAMGGIGFELISFEHRVRVS